MISIPNFGEGTPWKAKMEVNDNSQMSIRDMGSENWSWIELTHYHIYSFDICSVYSLLKSSED